ncbi:MAG TPA: (Fe-S)-binding protein [Thermoanaerobaculia bacterium]|nr:(Fe-S)-binding protein [Thermoanaerobaculia bacterium]
MTAIAELRRSSGALRCIECGKCSTLCPLSEIRDFSAVRMAAIHDRDSDLVRHAELVNRCLTCGSCEVRCPQNVTFTKFVRGLREELPQTLRTPCPHGTVLQSAARLMAGSNGAKRDLSWIGDGLRVAERGEVALFVGCAPLFDVVFARELGIKTIEIARAAIRLMNAAGIEPVILDRERCCGHDLLWNGEVETFQRLAASNAAAFEERGVKHIVSACAECCRTWKIDYAEAVPGYKPKVEHITEFLARSNLKFNGQSVRVTYQDPCRLARHLGMTGPPREVIRQTGAELVEMELHGVDGRCCGTPGFMRCDRDARRMQEERLTSAALTEAEVMLTACPKCWIHFACADSEDRLLGKRDRAPVKIQDLTMFAAERMEHS